MLSPTAERLDSIFLECEVVDVGVGTWGRKLCSAGPSPRPPPPPPAHLLMGHPLHRLALQYTKKRATVSKCGDCKCNLRGIKALRPKGNIGVPKRNKHVSRAYGGARCGTCVRQRIVRCVPRPP